MNEIYRICNGQMTDLKIISGDPKHMPDLSKEEVGLWTWNSISFKIVPVMGEPVNVEDDAYGGIVTQKKWEFVRKVGEHNYKLTVQYKFFHTGRNHYVFTLYKNRVKMARCPVFIKGELPQVDALMDSIKKEVNSNGSQKE